MDLGDIIFSLLKGLGFVMPMFLLFAFVLDYFPTKAESNPGKSETPRTDRKLGNTPPKKKMEQTPKETPRENPFANIVFKCPECGSEEVRGIIFLDKDFVEGSPWNSVGQVIQCGKCGRGIPPHLSSPKEGMTYEDAKKEWRKVFRNWKSDSENRGPKTIYIGKKENE